jgi:uncharacterized RDD family membrane protein YckC
MSTFDRRLRAFSIDTSLTAVLVLFTIFFDIEADIKTYLWFAIYFGVALVPYLFGTGQSFGKRIQKTKIRKKQNRKSGLLKEMSKIIEKKRSLCYYEYGKQAKEKI